MAREITVEDLTPRQKLLYNDLVAYMRDTEKRLIYFHGFSGRQAGKTTVTKLVLKELERLDQLNE